MCTVVGLSSFLECVAISYEPTQLYSDCPVEWLTFPIERAESPAADSCLSPRTAAFGCGAVPTDMRNYFETEGFKVAPQDDTGHFQNALIISQNPLGHHVSV